MNTRTYKEIGDLALKWKDYPNEYNPDDPINRKALIEKNMRVAADVAMYYRNSGLTEEELISAAAYGLCIAYDKYNPANNKLKSYLLSNINENTTYPEFEHLVVEKCKYGKIVEDLFANKPQTYNEMVAWINQTIKSTTFANYARFWCRACVLQDITKYKYPVYLGAGKDDTDVFCDIISCIPYLCDKVVDEEYEERLQLLWEGIDEQAERMLMMRNGIGADKAMTYTAIAEEFGITQNEARDIVNQTMTQIKANIKQYGLQMHWFLPN